MDKWKVKRLRVIAKRLDYDPQEDKSGNENYVDNMREYYKNTNDYTFEILKKYGYFIIM